MAILIDAGKNPQCQGMSDSLGKKQFSLDSLRARIVWTVCAQYGPEIGQFWSPRPWQIIVSSISKFILKIFYPRFRSTFP